MFTRCLWLLFCVSFLTAQESEPEKKVIPKAEYQNLGAIWGLEFSDDELDMMAQNLYRFREGYRAMREHQIGNEIAPALIFESLPNGLPELKNEPARFDLPKVRRPENDEDLAFMSVLEQAALLRSGQLTSLELTTLYLNRLKTYGPRLECVVSLLEDEALAKAKAMDLEIAAGRYRSHLHGIPYGAKDLFAVKGTKTSWGAMPYKDQVIDDTATVIKKLDDAGAVLVAKLTLGALAMGDVWYGGKTRNPWNLEKGSSGSSAGSASATSAGLVAFALGTETSGSIVSPATRCGVTGLRPSFGRVSRKGAMALSWSMDKIGPITRSVRDAAAVFDVIRGSDKADLTVTDAPFPYAPSQPWKDLRIGMVSDAFDADYPGKANDLAVIEVLRKAGATITPVNLPKYPVSGMYVILFAEAAAAFDDLTRSNRDDELVAQKQFSWPNSFRSSRSIPAVEYIQANRLRTKLMAEMAMLFDHYDVLVVPSYGSDVLQITNLSGHPCVVVPNGFVEDKQMGSISFIGGMFREHQLVQVAAAYQDLTDFHTKRPQAYKTAE